MSGNIAESTSENKENCFSLIILNYMNKKYVKTFNIQCTS